MCDAETSVVMRTGVNSSVVIASAEAKNAAAGLQQGDRGAAQGATNTAGISAS